MIHQSFKSLFTGSSYIKFGHPLSLFLLSVHLITILGIGASLSLRCICPNHLKRCCTIFSSTGVTPSLSHISSFRTAYVQTILNDVARSSSQLVSPLPSHVCHRSGLDLFLCGHKSIVACASQLRLVVGHVAS
jgi:hypothetical protein